MKLGIVSDHRGYELKGCLVNYLKSKKIDVIDYGTDSLESTDYVKYGILLGKKIMSKEVDFGIAICGTGLGISIACNKVNGIRCAKVSTTKEAFYARLHNDANAIALNGDMAKFRAKDIVDAFISTDFSNAPRHIDRVKHIISYEKGEVDE